MNKIVFTDKTEFEIMPGSSIGEITAICTDFADLGIFTDALRKTGNLKNINFKQDELVTGTYENLTFASDLYNNVKVLKDGRVLATFALRNKTDMELQIEQIQADQLVQDGAIMDLAEMLGGTV